MVNHTHQFHIPEPLLLALQELAQGQEHFRKVACQALTQIAEMQARLHEAEAQNRAERNRLEQARAEIDGYQKQRNQLEEDIAFHIRWQELMQVGVDPFTAEREAREARIAAVADTGFRRLKQEVEWAQAEKNGHASTAKE